MSYYDRPLKRSLSESSTGSSNCGGGDDTPTHSGMGFGGGGGGNSATLSFTPGSAGGSGGPPFKIPKKTDLMGGGLFAFHRRESQASTASSLSTQQSVSETEDDEEEGQQLSRALDSPVEETVKVEPSVDANYSSVAQKLMSKMGYVSGKGLGKVGQGRVEPVGASSQKGRRGLGLVLKGLEEGKVDWDASREHVVIEEEVKWMPPPPADAPPASKMHEWMLIGRRKKEIGDEHHFCDPKVLSDMLDGKTIFDHLEPRELMKARERSNPFETIRGAFFLNRAAMKMANMDAVFDFMFTNPRTKQGQEVVGNHELLYFADVCAGPGGFSEYVLWRKQWRSRGFGFTLKGPCDFKLQDFLAGPSECFEPHYGVNGRDGDGNIFSEDNIMAFKNHVLASTDGKGVHFMMADGGFSVDGQENIQEILSKQLYLCQFLVALGIVREGGNFVCKLFDVFTPFSVGLIYLMRMCFDQVCLHKPNTSRPANSERYLVCKWKRRDTIPVFNYMLKINAKLNELEGSNSDVNQIVPFDLVMEDREFVQYMKESNDAMGEWQTVGLSKIAAFCKDSSLREDARQFEVRKACMEFWKVPDIMRKVPNLVQPQVRVQSLLGVDKDAFLVDKGTHLEADNLSTCIRSVYDWKFVINSSATPTFYFGMGRGRVYRYLCQSTRWEMVTDSSGRFELPADTLIYAEVVNEFVGENFSSRKRSTVHIIDAVFIGGEDLRKFDFKRRNEQVRLMCKAVNKSTRSENVTLRAKEVFSLENLSAVMGTLKKRVFKGTGPKGVMTFDVSESNYFVPASISLFRIVKDPYTIALSKTHRVKYWFNCAKNESHFKCPKDAVIDFQTSFVRRLNWMWEEGVGIDPQHEMPPGVGKVNVVDFMKLVSKLGGC